MDNLFGFFVPVEVGLHVEIRKQNDQSDQVNAIEIQLITTEATIDVQGRG